MIKIYAFNKFGNVDAGIGLPYVGLLSCLIFALQLMLQLLLYGRSFFSFNFRKFHRIIGHFLARWFFNYLNFLLFLFKSVDVELMEINSCFHWLRRLLVVLVLNFLSCRLVLIYIMPRQWHERISINLVGGGRREDSFRWPA